MDPTFLFKEGRLTYRILTREHRDAALAVLARAFCTEPCCHAFAEVDPKMTTCIADWVEFFDYWMDDASTNGMSVYAVDEEKHRIAGVFIVRELLTVPPAFIKKYSSDEKTLTSWLQLIFQLDADATKTKPELGEPGKAADLWALGVHPDYRGQKIANHLIRGIVPLTKKNGYKFATILATSEFTSMAAKFNHFDLVCKKESKEMLWKGKEIYKTAKPPHGTWAFWYKDLDTI